MFAKKYILTLALASTSASFAVTIGAVRGDVWLEQALDVTVPIVLDPAMDMATACAAVELAYGDTPVDSRHVRLTQEPGAEAASMRLRIVSTAPVNDALVNLTVQVGCEQKVVRRFQLLPDVPPMAPALRTPLVPEVPVITPEPSTPVAISPKPQRKAEASGASSSASHDKEAPAARRKATAPTARAAAPVAATPHLTLDPLAVMERRLVPDQASHAPDSEMLAAQEELQRLRQDYQGLQLQALRTEAEFATLREHLAKAESDRNRIIALTVGAFFALVAVVAAGLAWWARRERARMAASALPDADTQALLSDLHPVAADKWMAPGRFQPDLEEEPPATMVDIDLALSAEQQPVAPR